MTPTQFRKLALTLPQTEESAHMGHPDFRVSGKIFASLGPDEDWAMVKLTPSQQSTFLRLEQSFEAFPGAWGKRTRPRNTVRASGTKRITKSTT